MIPLFGNVFGTWEVRVTAFVFKGTGLVLYAGDCSQNLWEFSEPGDARDQFEILSLLLLPL